MKKLFPILMVVALTAGGGSGIINGECDSSHENFCDGDILYRVDFCGNAVPMGHCEHGCNLEFTGCQAACDTAGSPQLAERAKTMAPVETNEQMTAGLRNLPQIDPIDR